MESDTSSLFYMLLLRGAIMNIHVGTQFHRKHLLNTLIMYLKPMEIEWYPVCDSNEIAAFDDNIEDWIHPILCEPLQSPPEHACRKLNDFLDSIEINDDDYYCFLGDDDMYEQGFFDTIREQTAEIVMCSLSRGNAIPEGAHPHPTYPLIISGPESVRVYNIGMAQYIMKGKIAKQIRFKNQNNFDDGLFAEELKSRWPNKIEYLPYLFVFGNYFEPGRYTDDSWKLKDNWRLPVYV